MPLTARMEKAWDAYQRHGGDGTPGSQSKAARELGISQGGLKSAIDAYRRNTGLPAAAPKIVYGHKRLTPSEQVAQLVERQEAVERHLESLLASQAALSVQVAELLAAVRPMLARQPLILEVRPTHRRKADGGDGGRREGRRALRDVAEAVG